jgi:hypothetical protein
MALRLQLAKPGKFGIDGTVVTEQALRDAVETFESDVPITLGHHLADFMPAFGWVKSVEYSEPEKILYGDVELSDVLKDAFEEGLYKKWSVGIHKRASDGKRFLHHLAFLGAVPPKIKDLKIMDSKVINMSDVQETWTFPDESKQKEEVKIMPKDEGKDLELADAKKKASDLETALRNAKKDALKKAIEGKVPAAKAGLVMELADHLTLDETIELSDDAGKRKVSAFDILSEIFALIPLPVKPGSVDMGDAPDTGGSSVDAAAMIKSM